MLLYIYKDEICLRKSNSSITIGTIGENKAVIQEIPVKLIDAVMIFGRTSVSTDLITHFAQNGINILYCNKSGRLNAITNSFSASNVNVRLSQAEVYAKSSERLDLARKICRDKIKLQLDFLSKKRNINRGHIEAIKKHSSKLLSCASINEIMGVEGICAREYFKAISEITEFSKRVRHPAKDPLNSMLDLSYSLILSEITSVLTAIGFDVSIGFLHEVKNGRPSLALDILEYFRTDADSFVINAFNRHEVKTSDFDFTDEKCVLSDSGFRKFIEKFNKSVCLTDRIISVCSALKDDITERRGRYAKESESEALYNCI